MPSDNSAFLNRKIALEDIRHDTELSNSLPPGVFIPPPKPKLEDHGISDSLLKKLDQLKSDGDDVDTKARIFTFISVALVVMYLRRNEDGYIVIGLFAGGIAAAMASVIWKQITEKPIDEWYFRFKMNNDLKTAHEQRQKYNLALAKWEVCNREFERVISRRAHVHWLSRSGKELEDAVADFFMNQGYEVELTPHSYDNGIDLILRLNSTITVVQCKAFGKPCGPSAVRDLFGSMNAYGASEAILVCPRGFTQATKDFANDKPIKLFDVDDLSAEIYQYESYFPHWAENCKSVEELARVVYKRNFPQQRRRRKF
jgi:hypothetical protein